jgi:sortase A
MADEEQRASQEEDGSVRVQSRSQRRRARLRLRRMRRTPWILIAAGGLVLVGVGAWQLYVTLWTHHSERVGKALVQHFLHDHALGAPLHPSVSGSPTPATASLATCPGSAASTSVHGLLEVPSLGIVAPVEQGTGEAVLAVAVGHDPHSVWPGKAGNAVLLAHDVSYFSTIDQLADGATIRYVTPCTTYVFQVDSHAIVAAGSPVYNTAAPTVTLVTCWPTDALWFTPDRYLVTATEVSKSATATARPDYLTAERSPRVPVPASLASQGVTLATYSLPMGTFTLSGSPDRAWAQTTSPLLVSGSAVEAFIAGVRSLTESHLDWWHAIAPGVDPPAPLVGAHNPSYLTGADVTERARGFTVEDVTLTVTVSVDGGTHPGRYSMDVRTTVHDDTMTISSWSMTRA